MIDCAFDALASRLLIRVPCSDLESYRTVCETFAGLDAAMDIIQSRLGDPDLRHFAVTVVPEHEIALPDAQSQLAAFNPYAPGNVAFWTRVAKDSKCQMQTADWLLRIEDTLIRAARYKRARPGVWETAKVQFGEASVASLRHANPELAFYCNRLDALWTSALTAGSPKQADDDAASKVILKFRRVS